LSSRRTSTASHRTALSVLALAALACLAACFPAVAAAGSISGAVTSSTSGFGIGEVEVCAWSLTEEGEEGDFGCAETESDGSYEVVGLDPHEYLVEFWDPYAEYATQFFNHQVFYWEANPVTVGAGAVNGIDAELDLAGEIHGTVRNAANGAGLDEIEVCAWEEELEAGFCTYTDSSGDYALRRIVSGDYKVEFWPYDPFDIQYWDHKANWSEANELPVDPGDVILGIDGDLLGAPQPPVTKPPVVTPPAVTPPLVTKPKPKPCKRGFRKKKVKGKVRCVKVRKHRKHRGQQKSRRATLAYRLAR
jgi:hypothetical protein